MIKTYLVKKKTKTKPASENRVNDKEIVKKKTNQPQRIQQQQQQKQQHQQQQQQQQNPHSKRATQQARELNQSPLGVISSSDTTSNSTSSNNSAKDAKIEEVIIKNFQFSPKKLYIKLNTIVKWIISDNQNSYDSGLYTSNSRYFIITIDDLDIESNMLRKGDVFEHHFKQVGNYEIKCANYSQIKGLVSVYDEDSDLTLTKFRENYQDREFLLRSNTEINELIRPHQKITPPKTKSNVENQAEIQEFLIKGSDSEDVRRVTTGLSNQKSRRGNSKSFYGPDDSDSEDDSKTNQSGSLFNFSFNHSNNSAETELMTAAFHELLKGFDQNDEKSVDDMNIIEDKTSFKPPKQNEFSDSKENADFYNSYADDEISLTRDDYSSHNNSLLDKNTPKAINNANNNNNNTVYQSKDVTQDPGYPVPSSSIMKGGGLQERRVENKEQSFAQALNDTQEMIMEKSHEEDILHISGEQQSYNYYAEEEKQNPQEFDNDDDDSVNNIVDAIRGQDQEDEQIEAEIKAVDPFQAYLKQESTKILGQDTVYFMSFINSNIDENNPEDQKLIEEQKKIEMMKQYLSNRFYNAEAFQ